MRPQLTEAYASVSCEAEFIPCLRADFHCNVSEICSAFRHRDNNLNDEKGMRGLDVVQRFD